MLASNEDFISYSITSTGEYGCRINVSKMGKYKNIHTVLPDDRDDFIYLDPRINNLNLNKTKWGYILPKSLDKVENELLEIINPLIEKRSDDVGTEAKKLVYYDKDSAKSFLERYGIFDPGVITQNNANNVPYYLCILASPKKIPWDFQYDLGITYAVGRIWFDCLDDCEKYIKKLLCFEKTNHPDDERHKAIFFGPRHHNDVPTEKTLNYMIKPLSDYFARKNIDIINLQGNNARKENLINELENKKSPLSLLFTASHGLEHLELNEENISTQGALLSQNWVGGSVKRGDYFCGQDLERKDLNLSGLMVFSFACHSAGTPEYEDWYHPVCFWQQKRQAPYPFVAHLPQKLLASGALAFIGHVSKAWTSSVVGLNHNNYNFYEIYELVIELILSGHRVGYSIDTIRQTLMRLIVDSQSKKQFKKNWLAIMNCKSYVILGDSAARCTNVL